MLKHFPWDLADKAVQLLQGAEWLDLLFKLLNVRFSGKQLIGYHVVFKKDEPSEPPALGLSFLFKTENVQREAAVTVVVDDFQIDFEGLASCFTFDHFAHIRVQVVLGNGWVGQEALH